MDLFGNKDSSLSELNEDELEHVTRHLDGDSWEEILDEVIPVPDWLSARSKNWEHLPLLSFDTGENQYGNLFIIWDVELANGVLCDECSEGVLSAGAVPTLEPEAVSAQALAYIDDMWGSVTWLRDTEAVTIGRDDLLLRGRMYAYITANKESGVWDKAYGTASPEEWIEALYPKPKS